MGLGISLSSVEAAIQAIIDQISPIDPDDPDKDEKEALVAFLEGLLGETRARCSSLTV